MMMIFLPTLIGMVLRHGLTLGGGVLMANGWADPAAIEGVAGCFDAVLPANETATTVLGGVAAAVGLLWSGGEKLRRK